LIAGSKLALKKLKKQTSLEKIEFRSKSCETTTQRICRKPTLRAEKQKKLQKAVLSTENYAFEKLKTQRILLVENDFELELSCQTISAAYSQNLCSFF
jgi:hypothetical protein